MLEYNQRVSQHALEIDARKRQGEEELLFQEHPWLRDAPNAAHNTVEYEWVMRHFQELDTERSRDQGVPLPIPYFAIDKYGREILSLAGADLEVFVKMIRGVDDWLVRTAIAKANEKGALSPADDQPVNKRDLEPGYL